MIIDTDTRLNAAEKNTILHASPLDYKRLEGRTGGHLNHYLYGMLCSSLALPFLSSCIFSSNAEQHLSMDTTTELYERRSIQTGMELG